MQELDLPFHIQWVVQSNDTNNLGNNLGCLRIPTGSFQPTSQIEVTQSWYQMLSLVRRTVQLDISLIICLFYLDYIPISIYSRKLLLCQISILLLKWPLIQLYLLVFLPSLTHQFLPIQSCTIHSQLSILFPVYLSAPLTPGPYSVPNICSPLNYSLLINDLTVNIHINEYIPYLSLWI